MAKRKIDLKSKKRFFAFEVYSQDDLDVACACLDDDMTPYCYCIHDADNGKWHAHIMIDYGSNTNLGYIMKLYGDIAANGYIEAPVHPDKYFDYMYHNQDIPKAKGKHEYGRDAMVLCGGFEETQLHGQTDEDIRKKFDCIMEICNSKKIYEFASLAEYVSKQDRELYTFVLKEKILVNTYISSHRNRKFGQISVKVPTNSLQDN